MTAPAVEHGELEEARDSGLSEIFCPCNLRMTLCGIYIQQGAVELAEIPQAECCKDCSEVLKNRGCPYCGCSEDQECHLCKEPRHG